MDQKIIDEAYRLYNNPVERARHLHRTQKCRHASSCNLGDRCKFAHSWDEYRLPICFFKFMKFCRNPKCTMYHMDIETKEQFVSRNQIDFEKKEMADNHFTKMCTNMSADKPCERGFCSYAHSLDELVLHVAHTKHNKKIVAEQQGIVFQPFMLRETLYNRQYLLDYQRIMKEQQQLIKDLEDETCDLDFSALTLEDEEDEDNFNVIIDINSISQLQITH